MKWIKKILESRIDSIQLEIGNILHEQHEMILLVGRQYFKTYAYDISRLKINVLKFEKDLLKCFIKE